MKRAILIALLAACLAALAGGAWKIFGRVSGIRYEDAAAYAAGGTTLNDAVENLDIQWTDGSVNIEYHAQDTVVLAETAKKPVSGDRQMRWWLDGTTLHVRYAKSGVLWTGNLNKALTLTLPEGTALRRAEIRTASGDVNIPALEADSLLVETASGDMNIAAGAATLTAASSSGDIALRQSGAADAVTLSTASGSINCSAEDAAALTATSTSGDIDLTQAGRIDALRLETTSGEIRAALDDVGQSSVTSTSGGIGQVVAGAEKAAVSSTSGSIRFQAAAFGEVTITSTSGDVTAALPAQPGLTADIRTTSGGFESGIALAKDGKAYTCGDGSGRVSIHTTSGDVRLQ